MEVMMTTWTRAGLGRALALGLAALLAASTASMLALRQELVTEVSLDVEALDSFESAKRSEMERLAADTLRRVQAEFELTGEETFSSVEEFQALIGHQCTPLRHCGHKIMSGEVFFFGGGLWDPETKGFNPYPCWMYNVKGHEHWLTGMLESGHVVVHAAIGSERPSFELDSRFASVVAEVPATADQEADLVERIMERVQSSKAGSGADALKARVTLAVQWGETFVDVESALVVGRTILRVARQLDVESVDVLWMNQPYRAASVDADIDSNEYMKLALEKILALPPDEGTEKHQESAPGFDASKTRKASANMGGLDVFGPSLAAPRAADPLEYAQMFATSAVWNVMLRKYIMHASAERGLDHLCADGVSCSACTPVLGSIPSSRASAKLLLQYMSWRGVANKIEILDDEHVWSGTWDSLVKINGNAKIRVRSDYLSTATRRKSYVSLKTYLDEVGIYGGSGARNEDGLPKYAGNNRLSSREMENFRFRYPGWIDVSSFERPAMWLGPRGSMSPIHVDHITNGNLAFQVIGTKRWILFPRSADDLMYLRRAKTATTMWSALDDPWAYAKPEVMQAYPDFRYAFCLAVPMTLRPGEMVYNPYGWWHAVKNLDDSLMVNFWMKPSSRKPPPGILERAPWARFRGKG